MLYGPQSMGRRVYGIARVNCRRNTNFEMARCTQNWLGKHDVKFSQEYFELKIFFEKP